MKAALASVGSRSLLPTGTLRVAAPACLGPMHLILALQTFMDTYPGLTIDCRLSDSITDLVEGGFDIVIRNADLKYSRLIARKLTD